MGDIHSDPIDARFLFWAMYIGGDRSESDKMQWVRFYPSGSGGGLRHVDAEPGCLLRYDRKSREFGITIDSTFLNSATGGWRYSDSAERNYFLGSDNGDGVSPQQATEILVAWGYPPELLIADPIPDAA